jgi:hypothetical protein
MESIYFPLDSSQQLSIALWATKTAMVTESIHTRSLKPFYLTSEREQLRLRSIIPENTFVWIGRYSGRGMGVFDTKFQLDTREPERDTILTVANGYTTTVVVGHLAIQTLTFRALPKYRNRTITVKPRSGLWDKLLLDIWPVANLCVGWPPALNFTITGLFPIAILITRWKSTPS